MKKILTLIFVIALLISACGQSTPATVSAPEVTNTPANTSTPEATATAEVSPTLEESPTQTPKTALLVSEFSPSCFGTETYSGDWGKMFTKNGELHLATNPPNKLFVPCKEKEFSDFTFEADAALVDNGGSHDRTNFGLIFRANPQQFYEFDVAPNGQAILYYVEKKDYKYKPLFDWTPIPSFETGDIVHLKVTAIGDKISTYVNDQLIKSIQDTTLTSGAVGFVINSNESTQQEAFFKNAKVTDEVANAPANTSTSQESPSLEMQKSYAVISADKAEFWFPLPDREWQWFVLPKTDAVHDESAWSVRFEVDKIYEIYVNIANNDNLPPQKGSAADMLKVAGIEISQLENMGSNSYAYHFTGFKNVNVTSIDGGLLIELTEQSLVQALYQSKPETVVFGYSYIKDYANLSDPKYEYGEFDVTPTYK